MNPNHHFSVKKQTKTDFYENASERKLRVAFVCENNPQDRRTWSGTPYGIFSALQMLGYDVRWISPKGRIYAAFHLFVRCSEWIVANVFRKNFSIRRWTYVAKILARRFKINDDLFDLIISPGLTDCAFYRSALPIVSVIDATFACFDGYYGRKTVSFFAKCANATELLSALRVNKIIAASQWAKNSLLFHYGIPGKKVLVWQLGANISASVTRCKLMFPLSSGKLKLLFVGLDTVRKGLAVAIETASILKNEYKRDVQLDVIGSDGSDLLQEQTFVRFYGRLNKNNPAEMAKFEEIVASAHVFILPTKAECAGMVFSEAAAYGLPVFSYDTGGVSSYVENGGNGILLPLTAHGSDFAKEIIRCWDNGLFPGFSARGNALFHEKLKWSLWSPRLKQLCETLVS